jgi:hypothetical protein
MCFANILNRRGMRVKESERGDRGVGVRDWRGFLRGFKAL